MKRFFALVLVACLVFFASCGAQDTVSVETRDALPAGRTSTTIEAATELAAGTNQETAVTTEKDGTAEDWKTAYTEYLNTLTEDSEHISNLEYVEYAFVAMPGLENPVLVVFGGWRDFYFYSFEDGQIVTAKQKHEDGEYDLIEAWVDKPVYYLDGCLYFSGGSGAPATIFTDEVSVKDGSLMSERVASKLCASAFGDRDYYHGRGEPEITESEYNAIVNRIEEKGKEIEFFSLKDLKG